MRTIIEQGADELIAALNEAGYAAFLVGGYVRDSLLAKPVSDIDIATSALPEQVIALFPRTVPTGLAHGTVTVLHRGQAFEVTTFRKEGAYVDHRRPSSVQFIDDLTEDLRRRDFTMNAMAIDAERRLIDPFGGRADLRDGVVRCVGDPRERFREDALRMLRCIRFAAAYGFAVEPETWRALRELAPLFRHIAMERVRVELDKIVDGHDPFRGLCLLADSGLMRYCKRKGPFGDTDEPWQQLKSSKRLPHMPRLGTSELRWAALCLELGLSQAQAGELLTALVFSNKAKRTVTQLIQLNSEAVQWGTKERFVRSLLAAGESMMRQWLALAEWRAACNDPSDADGDAEKIRNVSSWLAEIQVTSLRELSITGGDLAALGLKGERLGSALQHLLFEVAMGRVPNRKDALLSRAQNYSKEVDHL